MPKAPGLQNLEAMPIPTIDPTRQWEVLTGMDIEALEVTLAHILMPKSDTFFFHFLDNQLLKIKSLYITLLFQ